MILKIIIFILVLILVYSHNLNDQDFLAPIFLLWTLGKRSFPKNSPLRSVAVAWAWWILENQRNYSLLTTGQCLWPVTATWISPRAPTRSTPWCWCPHYIPKSRHHQHKSTQERVRPRSWHLERPETFLKCTGYFVIFSNSHSITHHVGPICSEHKKGAHSVSPQSGTGVQWERRERRIRESPIIYLISWFINHYLDCLVSDHLLT